jgi:hypothetical protein
MAVAVDCRQWLVGGNKNGGNIGGEEEGGHVVGINNRVNVLVGCGERKWECGVERESEFPLLHGEAYGGNSLKAYM